MKYKWNEPRVGKMSKIKSQVCKLNLKQTASG